MKNKAKKAASKTMIEKAEDVQTVQIVQMECFDK